MDYKNENSEMLDPDMRFLLANERTLLAWVRTGLTLQAGGFALVHFSARDTLSLVAGIMAILIGGIIAVIGYTRFRAADKAIREHRLPAAGKGPALQVITVVAVALVLSMAIVIDNL